MSLIDVIDEKKLVDLMTPLVHEAETRLETNLVSALGKMLTETLDGLTITIVVTKKPAAPAAQE